jgi:hypothetical protein
MHEKIAEMGAQAHLRNLAMQLVVQLQGHNKDEAREVLRLADELVDWQYGRALRGLKVVG